MTLVPSLPFFSPQTPADIIDNEFAFKNLQTGDTIQTATMTSAMGTLSITDVAVNGASVIGWITGGTPGQTATITCEIITTQGRTYNRSATMMIQAVV